MGRRSCGGPTRANGAPHGHVHPPNEGQLQWHAAAGLAMARPPSISSRAAQPGPPPGSVDQGWQTRLLVPPARGPGIKERKRYILHPV